MGGGHRVLISNSRGILVAAAAAATTVAATATATATVAAWEMMWKIMRSMPHANYDCVDYDALKLNEAETLFCSPGNRN